MKKLFLDRRIWERCQHLTLSLGSAQREDRAITVDGSEVWRSVGHVHLTITPDPISGYLGWRTVATDDQSRLSGKGHVMKLHSPDGFSWQTTGGPSIAETVILDDEEDDPRRRFKAIYQGVGVVGDSGQVEIPRSDHLGLAQAARDGRGIDMGIFSAVSADGLDWQDHRPVAINTTPRREWVPGMDLGANADTDPEGGSLRWWKPGEPGWCGGDSFPCLLKVGRRFVAYYRTNIDQRSNLFPDRARRERGVGRSECSDFGEWGAHELAMWAHTRWQETMGYRAQDFYKLQVWPAGDIYLAIVSVFYWEEDRVQLELAWSPDTIHWDRICAGRPLVPLGARGAPDFGGQYAAQRPLEVDSRLRVYYGAAAGLHNSERSGEGRIALATFAPNRLAGLSASAGTEGRLLTVPVALGTGVQLDADIDGQVRVGLCDETGAALAGFTVEDGSPLRGDAAVHELRWRGGSVASLEGRAVRLDLRVRDATLFSLKTS